MSGAEAQGQSGSRPMRGDDGDGALVSPVSQDVEARWLDEELLQLDRQWLLQRQQFAHGDGGAVPAHVWLLLIACIVLPSVAGVFLVLIEYRTPAVLTLALAAMAAVFAARFRILYRTGCFDAAERQYYAKRFSLTRRLGELRGNRFRPGLRRGQEPSPDDGP
jgi:hypothetical protein